MSSLPASIKKIRSKTTEKRWRHHFSHYKSMGAFCCHGNQSFDLICLKTLCSLSPTPVMLHIKFDLGWPAGFRNIQVWKCGRRRTDDGPLLYYKLTLWPFGSGELKIKDLQMYQVNKRINKHRLKTYDFLHDMLPLKTVLCCQDESAQNFLGWNFPKSGFFYLIFKYLMSRF